MTTINIERLTPGTLIHRKDDAEFGRYGDFAEVQECEFDPRDGSYVVTTRFLESNGARSWVGDTEVTFIVGAGESVEYGGINEPRLRDKSVIEQDELDAKTWAMIDQVDANRGCVSRNVDAQLVSAVADAVGVPLQMAAE